MEVLVTITLIAALMSLMVPCWRALTRIRSKQAAAGIVMESLEHARQSAITSKATAWVVFRHNGGIRNDSLRILRKQGGTISPLNGWIPLPMGISFGTGTENLIHEPPPKDILSASLNNKSAAAGDVIGSVMFQSSGRIGVPLPGGNALAILLETQSGTPAQTITLSRATGRATCK